MAGSTRAYRALKSRRLRRAACGASVLVLAAMGSGHALAQCAPDPSQAGQTTTCTGTQSGGYTIASDQSALVVSAGASVANSGDAVTVSIPASSYYDYRSTAITVNGSIASSAGNGIAIDSGLPFQSNYDYAGTSGTITVGAGGAVTGTTGITLTPYPGSASAYAQVNVTLDNSGSITGTAGPALATTGQAQFSTITNETSGSLGAVAASFQALVNNGTIAGGTASAVADSSLYYAGTVTNGGTIQSAGSATTILPTSGYLAITNSGTIANTGGGVAIAGASAVTNLTGGTITGNGTAVVTGDYLTVVNGGTISAGSGGTAIDASLSLNLTNAGTINGDVIIGGAGSIDSSLGTINGNVTFGSGGGNTLVASIANGAVQTGITGTITGGTGTNTTNTLQITSNADATLSSSVALPTNFAQLSFAPTSGTTLTLADGFSNPGTIIDQGPGTLTNATTLSGTGQIVNEGFFANNFTNTGSIATSNLGGLAAISLTGYASLTNSGSITATGDAVSGYGETITNSGMITAGGTAVEGFVEGFANSGTITSTGGTALVLSTSCTCTTITNSGTISGATIGVQLDDGVLNNSGTITSPGIGIALTYYSTINNQVRGVISGGTYAIGDPTGAPGIDHVSNAGTINGNVYLANSGFSTNTYDAAPGGILNGNLTLGSGDTLIADLVNSGSGAFAGISGTVTASNSNLVYNVSADATISTAPPGFSSVAYQLFGNPTLTIAAGTTSNTTLVLAGTGTVDLNGTIATVNSYAVNSQSALVAATGYNTSGVSLLAINNAGAIANTLTVAGSGIGAALVLGSNSLVNSGSITLTDNSGNTNPYLIEAAVSGGQSITNSGTITGVNAGAVAFGNYYYSSSSVPTLTNSGTLTSNTTTVQFEYEGTIDNSGMIASTGQTVIGQGGFNYYFGPILIDNQVGGTISGSGDAIELEGGTVQNAGTINGNVNLNYPSYGIPVSSAGTYYDLGGTLNGNLTLNPDGGLVIDLANQQTGPLGGVTGTINANGAALIYNVTSNTTTSATGSGASGFGTIGYLISNNATLTLDANSNLTSALGIAGNGAVILNGTVATNDVFAVETQLPTLLTATGNSSGTNALTLTNNGIITTAADTSWSAPTAVTLGSGDTLINNGTIALTDSVVPYDNFGAVFGGLSVTNNGTISAANVSAVSMGTYYATDISLTNTGTITSNVTAVTPSGGLVVTNSGTIASTGGAAFAEPGSLYYGYPVTLTNLSSGIISGVGDAIDLPNGTVVNAGTINGNVNLMPVFLPGSGGYYDNGGTINGDLTLALGQVLLVNYGATTGPLGGVTGTIDANGAALLYNVASDTTITAAPLASGFGLAGYQLSNNATLTIPGGIALTNTLALAGTGSVVLNGTIATSDQPAVESIAPLAQINSNVQAALIITNNGTIATTTDSPYATGQQAVSLGLSDTLINNGSITLTNTSGFAGYYDAAVAGGLAITNTGAITGSGVAAIDTGSYASSPTTTLTNSGTLSSDQTTILASGKLLINNSGAIVSSGAAAINGETYYFYSGFSQAQISNLANGVISGVGDAVDLTGGSLANAGTINGNVNLAYSPYGGTAYAPGAYFNNGGTLNGNLILGPDQSLYTALGSVDVGNIGNAGSVQGITGTVAPNGAALVYTVTANATDAATIPTGFAEVDYQFAANATLTLAPIATLTLPIDLSGTGSVIFNGSIAASGLPAIISSPAGTVAGAAATPNDLTITNNGTLSSAFPNNVFYGPTLQPSTVFLASGDTLINTGSITLTNATGTPFPIAAAVYGGAVLNNSGTISGVGADAVSLGVASTSTTAALSLTNSGSITSDQLAVQTNAAATITNSGTISGGTGGLLLGGAAQIVNSGGITSSGGIAIAGTGAGTLITNQASGIITGSSDAIDLLGGTVANSGAINGNVDLAFGVTAQSAPLSGGYFATGGTLTGNLVLGQGESLVTDIANPGAGVTGTVTASGTTLIYNVAATTTSTAALPTGFTALAYQLLGNPTLTLASGSNLATTLGLAGSGAVIFAGTIATTDAPALQSQPLLTASGYAVTANALAITNTGTISAIFDAAASAAPGAIILGGGDSLTNSGTITSSGAPAVLKAGVGAGQLVNLAGGVISSSADAIDFAGGTITNAGTITGNVNLGYAAPSAAANTASAIYVANGGTINGNLVFSSAHGGNELIETGAGFGVSGTIAGGGGTNYIDHLRTVSGTVALGSPLPTGFSVELTYVDGASHQITLTGPASSAANIYVGGNGAIINQVNTGGIVTGLAATGEVYFTGMSARLASFTNQAQVGGIVLATNTLVNSGTVGSPNIAAPALTQTVDGTLSFTNSGTIAAGPLVGVASQRAVLIDGSLTGASQITNSGTIIGGLAAAYVPAAGATLGITNTGTIFGGPANGTQDRALAVLPTELAGTTGDAVLVTNSGTITGDILLAAASDTLVDTAGGAIRGNIILQPSAGTGSITLAGNFAGSIDGGQGPTSLTVSGGSAAQPVAFAAITDVAGYSQTGGYATLGGTANVGTAAITGGTFVGLVGSTLNASLVTVGSGATFASGGTITGNLAVGGTLHVGASPDTLTVKGNVALAPGSTSVFEVSPTASSKLVVSGQVAIGTGTAVQIVQLQPLAPGAAIDLIDAAGGIAGKFATITGIDAALVEQGGSLSLRALFDVAQTANPQATRGANYLNALIVSGTASPALLAALPALQTAGGPPITGAFARLAPEPYASAEQIGIENALMLSRSLRDLNFDDGLHSGQFFTFGEALGNRRGLGGNAAVGTSNSTLSGYGFIGGLGIGSRAASLAAFGGYIDQTQTIDALAATTHAKGFVGGVTGRLASGGAQLNVSAIRDDAHASTDRQSPDRVAVTGDYSLHSWTLDGELTTRIALGEGWAARPHVGATWVRTTRGAADEDNLSAFALTVAGDRHDAAFVDGGVRFDGANAAVGEISPYVDLGLRHKLLGRAVAAVAGIDGGPVTLFSAGDRRRRNSGLVEAGVRYRVNSAVSLFLTGNGDFSRDESSGTATGGVTVRF